MEQIDDIDLQLLNILQISSSQYKNLKGIIL